MTRTRGISLVKVLIIALVLLLVVLPVIAMIAAGIPQARWRANHPVLTVVPNVRGFDPAIAETAVRTARLKIQILSTPIDSRCWQTQLRTNTIVDQTPEGGMPVPVGTLVRLEIGVENGNQNSNK